MFFLVPCSSVGVRNPIEVELFTPKVVEEEMDGDKSTVDNGTSTQPTEEVSVT